MSEVIRSRERFSPAQSRAGRGLLAWTPAQLAQAAGLELEAVELYEAGESELGLADLVALGWAFNDAGVIAIAARYAGEGVRLRRPVAADCWGATDAPAMARRVADLATEVADRMTDWP